MEIRVKCSCGEDKCPEWALIEVQGVVEIQPSYQSSIQNLHIGQLCRPSSQETYTFTIGYHELMGSKVTLKKPLLVLKKIKLTGDEKTGKDGNSTGVELEVLGVIRHKILFNSRPRALISRPEPVLKKKDTAAAED